VKISGPSYRGRGAALSVCLGLLMALAGPASAQTTQPAAVTQVERLRALDFAPFDRALAALPADRLAAAEALLRSGSILDLQKAMAGGTLSAETLTLTLLHRIRQHDGKLRAYLELNPQALDEARQADRLRASGTVLGPMHGIPVSLKDNIDTAGPMHTTAGSEVLLGHVAKADAPLAAQLRAGGAVILGKANLSELAGVVTLAGRYGGTSAVGGRAMNPFGDALPTGGSSSGSAVGAAALLAVVSVGTETSGSLIAPAAWQGTVGMKPSRSLVNGAGVVPLLSNNDSPGPVARSVTDAALLLDAIDSMAVDYAAGLSVEALVGKTVGLLGADILATPGHELLFQRSVVALLAAGARVRPARIVSTPECCAGDVVAVFLASGMRHDMMPGLAARGAQVATLDALLAHMKADPSRRMPFGAELLEALAPVAAKISLADHQAMGRELTRSAAAMLDAAFAASGADVLMSFANQHSTYYATAGYPAVTVPVGLLPDGKPMGITLIGKPGGDAVLLAQAYAYEQASRQRPLPSGY
jgi:amidase